MMGFRYPMMNTGFGDGFGVMFFLFQFIVFADLILLGVWLWKQIQKK